MTVLGGSGGGNGAVGGRPAFQPQGAYPTHPRSRSDPAGSGSTPHAVGGGPGVAGSSPLPKSQLSTAIPSEMSIVASLFTSTDLYEGRTGWCGPGGNLRR